VAGSNIEAANVARERARKGRTVSRAVLAEILGVASSTVDNYAKAGMPETVKGRKGVKSKVDTAQVIQWLIGRERAKVIDAVRARAKAGSAAAAAALTLFDKPGKCSEAGASAGSVAAGSSTGSTSAGSVAGVLGGDGVDDLFGGNSKDRKIAAEASLKEMDLAVRRGELVEIVEVTGVVEKMIADARTRLRSIPTKIAPEVALMTNENEIQASVEAKIDEVLTEISKYTFRGTTVGV